MLNLLKLLKLLLIFYQNLYILPIIQLTTKERFAVFQIYTNLQISQIILTRFAAEIAEVMLIELKMTFETHAIKVVTSYSSCIRCL